jgi:hypothetical protein
MPDHISHASDGALPPELHEMAEAIQADSALWQRQVPPPDRLHALYASLSQDRVSTVAPTRGLVVHPSPYHEGLTPVKKHTAWWGGMGAVALVAALLIAFLTVFHTHAPSSTPPPAATVQTLHVTPADGWVKPAALSFGKGIAFAHSDPVTGYVCGNTVPFAGTQANAPIRFTATHDGGRTWHEEAITPASGIDCVLYINPNDAREIVMLVEQPANVIGWRSFDGGMSWQMMTLPPGDSGLVVIEQPRWAGATLFVNATYLYINSTEPALPHILAASTSGRPFAWVDTNPLFQHDVNGALHADFSFVLGTTYYAQLYTFVCTSVSCDSVRAYVLRTSDGGAHWMPFSFGKDAPATVFTTLADGRTLLGVTAHSGKSYPAISRDKGQTWHTLPAIQDTAKLAVYIHTEPGSSAPDGTLFAWEATNEYDGQGSLLHTRGPYTLLVLPPGASAWQAIPHLPGVPPFAVSVDGAGHPVAVWSGLSDGENQVPGIAYHAPSA